MSIPHTPSPGTIVNPYAPGASTSTPTPTGAPGASSGGGGTGFDGAPRERVGRSFRFNTKGKYVQMGNQMRQEAQLEALKQRIAESARKAGLDSEFETLEKNIRVSFFIYIGTFSLIFIISLETCSA
jgi:U4/U6 small nuclear ribonucleoprotein PRP3